ncbi:hypothetical protein Tco_0595796 [Tanacetum coccineum]
MYFCGAISTRERGHLLTSVPALTPTEMVLEARLRTELEGYASCDARRISPASSGWSSYRLPLREFNRAVDTRFFGVESAVIALTERLVELERDNMRLKGTASVESQRFDRLQRGMSRMQRELRQMRRLRFYDRVRVGRLEACARKKMPSTRSGVSMTREEFEEMVTRRVAEEMEAREAARTLEPLNENVDELEGENGGNGNRGNRGNRMRE